jgi:hypothetical protein
MKNLFKASLLAVLAIALISADANARCRTNNCAPKSCAKKCAPKACATATCKMTAPAPVNFDCVHTTTYCVPGSYRWVCHREILENPKQVTKSRTTQECIGFQPKGCFIQGGDEAGEEVAMEGNY